MITTVILMISVYLVSILLTGLIRRYALKHAVIDEPNHRSSHTTPTPRGGGLSISLAFILCAIILPALDLLPANYGVALAGGGLAVALVGWIDDHRQVPQIWRSIVYLAAACWALYWLGGLGRITVGSRIIELHYFGNIIAILVIVWLTILYNFMDGADGLAGLQAVCTSMPCAYMFWQNNQPGLAICCVVLACACMGFLFWNWPPARIFMGDVGSCLIGYSLAVLAVTGEKAGGMPLAVWIILLAPFICDATLTLFRRIYHREPLHLAHRNHAYQRLLQLGMDHRQLVLTMLAVDVLVLWPLAFAAEYMEKFNLYIVLSVLIIISMIWFLVQNRYAKHG